MRAALARSGQGRAWGQFRGEPQVGEDLIHGGTVGEERKHLEPALALWALKDVDSVHASEEGRPVKWSAERFCSVGFWQHLGDGDFSGHHGPTHL
jgi:hypothetical protein